MVPATGEFVLFEKSGSVETQPAPEAFQAPVVEPTPTRVVQGGLPLASFGSESITPREVISARRAEEVSRVIGGLRGDAVRAVAREQGLRYAA